MLDRTGLGLSTNYFVDKVRWRSYPPSVPNLALRWCGIAVHLTVFAATVTPLETSSQVSQLTAAECVIRHIDARGGSNRLRAVKTVTRTSRLGSFTFAAAWQAPDRYRFEQADQDSGHYDLRTAIGDFGWYGDPGGRRLTGAEVQQLREEVAWGWELLHLDALGGRVELVSDTPPRPDQIGLRVRFRSDRTITIWLDPKTYLEVGRSRVLRAPDGSDAPSFSETRGSVPSAGVLFPTTIGPAQVTFAVDVAIPANWFPLKFNLRAS